MTKIAKLPSNIGIKYNKTYIRYSNSLNYINISKQWLQNFYIIIR